MSGGSGPSVLDVATQRSVVRSSSSTDRGFPLGSYSTLDRLPGGGSLVVLDAVGRVVRERKAPDAVTIMRDGPAPTKRSLVEVMAVAAPQVLFVPQALCARVRPVASGRRAGGQHVPRLRRPGARRRPHPLRRLRARASAGMLVRWPVLLPGSHATRLAIWTQGLDTTLRAPVPHRQVVLTIPKRRRASCLYRRRLLGEIARVAARTVTAAIHTLTGERERVVVIVACLQTHDFSHRHGLAGLRLRRNCPPPGTGWCCCCRSCCY